MSWVRGKLSGAANVAPNIVVLRVASDVVQVEGLLADIGMGMCADYAHKSD